MNIKSKQRYREEYGRDLFLHIFNIALNDNQKHAIAKYLLSLINEPHKSIVSEFRIELNKVKSACEDIILTYPNSALVELQGVYKWLSKGKLLRKYHATAFVCCELKSYSYRKPRFDHYKILVLCSAVRLAEIGDNDSPLNKVFNEIRQLGHGNRDDVARTLPTPEDFPLVELIERLDLIRKDDSTPQAIQQSIDGYYITLKNAYEGQPSRVKRGNREPRKKCLLHLQTELEKEPGSDFDVLQIRELYLKGSKKIEAWENEEKATATEELSTFAVVAINQNTARELRENQVKARQVVQSIQRKKQYLPCDFQSLTSHEIKILCNSIIAIQAPLGIEGSFPYLLLSLLTGRSFESILSQSCVKKNILSHNGTGLNLVINYKAATFTQEQEVKHIIREVGKTLIIRLPKILSKGELNPGCIKPELVKNWLSEINKKYSTRLSVSRICQQIHAFQRQHNLDPVIAELLSGSDNVKTTGLPYSHIRQEKVQDFVNLYSAWLSKITENEKWKIEPMDQCTFVDPHSSIGSPLYLQEDAIKNCNIQHIQHLAELRDKGLARIVDFHNSYSLYIYRLICLASGYRPVVGACGRISDICLESGKYWISDKERREGVAARMIVLPEIAIQQVENYITHLDSLHFLGQSQVPELAEHIALIKAGYADMLFFINKSKIIQISPKTLKPFMTEQFPVAPNWHRHFLRSFLMTRENITPSMIDCFMGHEEMGQEGFGRFSGFSYADFKELSNVLQQLLISLEFKSVPRCKIR